MSYTEEQRNEMVITELDNLVVNAYEEENLNFNPDVIIDGKHYYFSPAQQLSNYICKKHYKDFRLTYEWQHLSSIIYFEKIVIPGSIFSSQKYALKQCIGVLDYDMDKNQIIFKKNNPDTEIVEFCKNNKKQKAECFGISYEIFKYLRNSDLIQFHTIEHQFRHNQRYIYTISKHKAVKHGRFLYFKGLGIQFFIPKEDFKCVVGSIVKNKKRRSSKRK